MRLGEVVGKRFVVEDLLGKPTSCVGRERELLCSHGSKSCRRFG
jgi:hypothetical protein